MCRTPHRNNLGNKKRLNLTMERKNLDKEVVMSMEHNTPIDAQGLSYKRMLKT